jgi:predicted AlkP superfamily pyrophosphatase or phosphodiesterase
MHSGFVNIYGSYMQQSDSMIAHMAADYLARERVDFAFIYLGLVDEIGHRHGWGSAEYDRAVEGADAAVAVVLDRLAAAGKLDQTACLLTADHGGHERGHGSEMPEDMTVPWILAGPGIRRRYALTTPVRITDTAPTIAHLLGVPLPAAWQGKPVLEALHDAGHDTVRGNAAGMEWE